MNKTTTGWVIFITAFGIMLGLVGLDMVSLTNLHELSTPKFIGTTLIHISTTIAAFAGGKMIPESRDGQLTRKGDV